MLMLITSNSLNLTYSEVRKLWLNDLLFIWRCQTRLQVEGLYHILPLHGNRIVVSGPQIEKYIWVSNPCFLMLIKILFWGITDTKKTSNWIKSLFLQMRSWQTDSRTKSGSLPDFVNHVLLIHSYTHSFTHYLWLLSCYHSRAEQLWQSPYDTQDQKYLLWSEGTNLPTSALDF